MFRQTIIAGLAAVTVTLASPALADNIDFGQFGAEFTAVSSPLRGTTADGVGFTLVAPGPLARFDQGSFWNGGAFAPHAGLLFSGAAGGQIVLYFDHALTSLNSIGAEPDLRGPFTATLNAYLAGVLVTSSVQSAVSPVDRVGLVVAGSFDSVGIYTDHAGLGFAIGGTAPVTPPPGVPEPTSWALFIAGFSLTGAALRRRAMRVVAA